MTQPHVIVIGGGISGLTAAWTLSRAEFARDRDVRAVKPHVTVLEADADLGGKIRTSTFADVPVDLGPDAFLARHPAGVRLADELGIRHELVSPTGKPSFLWSRGHMHRLPKESVLGVPAGLSTIAKSGIVSPMGIARAAADHVLPRFIGQRDADPSLQDLVGQRLGREVLDRMVEPLIGGINAGVAKRLSVSSTAPQIAGLQNGSASLMRGARQKVRNNRRTAKVDGNQPLFYAPPGGMATLIDTLAKKLIDTDTDIRVDSPVATITRIGEQWEVILDTGERLHADGVIVTTPAPITAGLLSRVSPDAARALADIRYASVALIRLAYTSASITRSLDGSGYLTPAVDHGFLTACSYASSKWDALDRPGQVIFRASAGRITDARAFEMSDDEVIAAAHKELQRSLGARRRPFAADVTRWVGAFPQYEPGHDMRIGKAERALEATPTLLVAGAAMHGLGIPACIATATAAADKLLHQLQ